MTDFETWAKGVRIRVEREGRGTPENSARVEAWIEQMRGTGKWIAEVEVDEHPMEIIMGSSSH